MEGRPPEPFWQTNSAAAFVRPPETEQAFDSAYLENASALCQEMVPEELFEPEAASQKKPLSCTTFGEVRLMKSFFIGSNRRLSRQTKERMPV